MVMTQRVEVSRYEKRTSLLIENSWKRCLIYTAVALNERIGTVQNAK